MPHAMMGIANRMVEVTDDPVGKARRNSRTWGRGKRVCAWFHLFSSCVSSGKSGGMKVPRPFSREHTAELWSSLPSLVLHKWFISLALRNSS